jgi:hypothetical protein
MKRFIFMVLFSLLLCISGMSHAATSDYAVLVTVSVNDSPAEITLSWPAFGTATALSVYRKLPSETSWGAAIYTSSSPETDTGFTD